MKDDRESGRTIGRICELNEGIGKPTKLIMGMFTRETRSGVL